MLYANILEHERVNMEAEDRARRTRAYQSFANHPKFGALFPIAPITFDKGNRSMGGNN